MIVAITDEEIINYSYIVANKLKQEPMSDMVMIPLVEKSTEKNVTGIG